MNWLTDWLLLLLIPDGNLVRAATQRGRRWDGEMEPGERICISCCSCRTSATTFPQQQSSEGHLLIRWAYTLTHTHPNSWCCRPSHHADIRIITTIIIIMVNTVRSIKQHRWTATAAARIYHVINGNHMASRQTNAVINLQWSEDTFFFYRHGHMCKTVYILYEHPPSGPVKIQHEFIPHCEIFT